MGLVTSANLTGKNFIFDSIEKMVFIILTKTSLMTRKKAQGMKILISESLAEIYHGARFSFI